MAKKKSIGLSLVIPCFNEPENISLVIAKLKKIVSSANHPFEIIIVDGCSDDETPNILIEEFKSLDRDKFKLILMEQRKGYGNDIVEGLRRARYDILGWTHADLQTDLQDVIKGFELYNSSDSKKLIVKGKRKKRQALEVIFTMGMQVVTFFLLKTNLNDINAQPKIFSKQFFKSFLVNDAPSDFSLDLYLLYMAKKNNFEIFTFPVLFKKRLLGEAKGGGGSWENKLNLISRTFKYILRLRRELIIETKQ